MKLVLMLQQDPPPPAPVRRSPAEDPFVALQDKIKGYIKDVESGQPEKYTHQWRYLCHLWCQLLKKNGNFNSKEEQILDLLEPVMRTFAGHEIGMASQIDGSEWVKSYQKGENRG